HGNQQGGDAADLVSYIKQCDLREGIDWLKSHGHGEQQLSLATTSLQKPAQARIVATYTYGEGRDAYYVDRYEPKDFRQWRMIDGERVNGTAAGDYQRKYKDGPWYRVANGSLKPHAETRTFPGIKPALYRGAELEKSGRKTVLLAAGEKIGEQA